MCNGRTLKDELRPGYGMKFSNVGKMIQGLNRYDLVIGIDLPEKFSDLRTIGDKLPDSFESFCDRIENTTLAHETCLEILPLIREYKFHEQIYQERITKRLEYDLIAILPDLDQRNHVDKAIRSNRDNYKFEVEKNKPYEWEYVRELKLPENPDEDKPGIRQVIQKHVSTSVDEELGNVYHLIKGMELQFSRAELERQDRLRKERKKAETDRITKEIVDTAIFNRQFGFTNGHSTDYALLELIDQVCECFDEKSVFKNFCCLIRRY